MRAAPATPASAPEAPRAAPARRRRRRGAGWALGLAAAGAAGWGLWRSVGRLAPPGAPPVPVAAVARGTVRIAVHARGLLHGGNAEMLVAPPVAGGAMSIQYLLPAGAPVRPGEVVVRFDTAPERYTLVQAQEALQQAQQEVIEARAKAAAQDAADAYALAKAKFDVERAQLQVRSNPILAAVDAEKNDLTLAAAEAHLRQLQQDSASRSAGNAAAIGLQQAAVRKAQADAARAEQDIAAMTLRARQAGYVAVQQTSNAGILYMGMTLPSFQEGDPARAGQAVAQIPNTATWEVALQVREMDAGHLAAGQAAVVRLVPFPGRTFRGRVASVGAASGPPWKRQVACIVRLTDPIAALRPGISASATITAGVLRSALWVPAEAVFNFGGHAVVYRRRGGGFEQARVQVVERSESQVVIAGLKAGTLVALANPESRPAAARAAAGAAAAVGGGR